MRPDLPTGTVTFCFTDVEGSTRLLHSLGEKAYAQALAEHRRLIRAACAAEGGVEVDTQGDAFFFAFPTAPAALSAAAAFTDALSSGPIQVRVGLHTGTPLLASEGYVGADVHFAARIAASAHGGQVVCSRAFFTACNDQSQALVPLPLRALGSHRLKDVSEPVSLYQLGEGSFPPLKTIANTNLPTPASSFLGREAELSAADELLRSTRLLTITGPGGAGKTRFCLELATRARQERFADYEAGVFSCFLSSLRDPPLVLSTICQTLNVTEQPGLSALDGLASHLQGRRMLLLLDNLEHLLACASELSALLERCAGLTLLVSSRELLRIGGETSYGLPPLAESEGITLFCERARLEPSAEIAELCRRLEGLPLALELAAARTAILTPAQLSERLSQRLDLLKGTRDADPRQQTLRATIEWSYDLLESDERRLFRSLSVFSGGCALEAAEEVCGASLDSLQSLVDKSLLRFTDGRFWMLETIREYAEERLQTAGEPEEVRRQHSEWVSGLAQAAEQELEGGDQAAWLTRLEIERDNLRAALARWEESEQHLQILEVSARCWRFWWMRGYWAEGRRWLDLGLVDAGDSAIAAEALDGAVFLAYLQQDYDATRRLAEQQLRAARLASDSVATAKALHMLGNVTLETHGRDDARALYEESLASSPDHPFARYTLHALGYIALLDEEPDRARVLLERSLAAAETHADEASAADTLAALAFAALLAGTRAEAASLLRRSTLLATELGDKPVIATRCLHTAAALLADEGAHREAARVLGAADQLLLELGAAGRGQLAELVERRVIDTIEPELGESEVAQERAAGRLLSLEDALDLALAPLD